MSIETTALYQEMRRRAPEIPAGPLRLVDEFERLRSILQEHGKYIVLLFPEYTPHDHTRHLDHLFALADRILGTPLYTRLRSSELVLLAFGLYAHDWGMAVSKAEQESLINDTGGHVFALLPDEPSRARAFISEADRAGVSLEVAWRDYLRRTHGLRSGARLRKHLEPLGAVFADAVAKIAEGHTLGLREVRDTDRYPLDLSVFGETVNLAALTTYVRMIDLLDIGEDRTPYALWKFVAPADPISTMEWQKHRALSPVSVKHGSALREILVSGRTNDPAVFAALADLQSWVNEQFAMSIAHLRTITGRYDLDLDSRIIWSIDSSGFEPLTVKFELDRTEVLGLLSSELYQDDPLAFVRELLQNSVDAIDMREALLARHGLAFKGEIRVRITPSATGLCIEWSDNGIGMDEDVLSSYFARLGRSWYRSREASRLGQIEAISQFGVGVLSCFAVSHKMGIETLRDPHVGGPRSGLVIEIPARESHFRIQTATSIPVGTTIRLEVSSSLAPIVSKESVCAALAEIARYVRHRITVNSDGIETEVGFLEKIGELITVGHSHDNLKIKILGMRGGSAEKFSAMITKVAFDLGDPAGDFHGHYSAIVPKRPSEVSECIGYKEWSLEGEIVNLKHFLTDAEQALFVKGIRVGPVSTRSRRGEQAPSLRTRYSGWIEQKLLMNLRRPSHVQFNLARSSARLESTDWLDRVWRDIAIKLRDSAFNWPLTNAADTALLLGSCAVFGGVPDCGLDALVEDDEIPLLIMRSGEGPIWSILKEFVRGEEFVEAPFELSYANSGELRGFGPSSDLDGWEGDDSLFPMRKGSSNNYPWMGPVLTFGHRALRRLGWCPVEIRMVRPPANEKLPLVCRVWKNSGLSYYESDRSGERHGEGRRTVENWRILKRLYADSPELLRFPAGIAEYAAIGSQYWNIEHPKIARIVATLLALADRRRQQQLSADGVREVSYLTGNDFIDYIVPSRQSGARLALEVPARLLAIAEKEGLAHAEPLVPSDFFPGTLEGYKNPYQYNLKGWKRRGTGLGRRLDESTELSSSQ